MARRRVWLGPVLVAVLVLAWALVGGRSRGWLGLPDGGAPAKGGLRVATWNLRNFPGEGQDLSRLRARLDELAADVVAVQEIRDEAALRALTPGRELRLSEAGGRGGQRLGFLFDPGALELVGAPREHAELAMGGGVRPGFSGYLRARAGGPDFHLLVVHLKSRPEGRSLRRSQWDALARVVEELRRSDTDVMVVGDFNPTGGAGEGAEGELAALDGVLAEVGLTRVPSEAGCSAYWEGARRDAWHEPSLLDLVWISGLTEAVPEGLQARSLLHCARHHCEAFRSTEAHPERDYADLSDHCPVIVDLRPGEDADP